jgi:hypothetical protein
MAAIKMINSAQKGIVTNYKHYDKFVESGKAMELQNSTLKWYRLAKAVEPVPPEIEDLAHLFLEKQSAAGNLQDLGELGFVILHRCGRDFYFLLVSTWRNDNELWETVYAKNGPAQTDFELFTFTGAHRGTFCIWELAAVWHEQQAWKRYLLSAKDAGAKLNYLQDCYRGAA